MKPSTRIRLDRFYADAEEMMDGKVDVSLAYDLIKALEEELKTTEVELSKIDEVI